MSLILSHWHCILPVVGILAALILIRKKPDDSIKDETSNK